jgi:hypothetical protein
LRAIRGHLGALEQAMRTRAGQDKLAAALSNDGH